MCKIAAVAGIKKKYMENTWVFLELLASSMSNYNNDGLGYAAISKEGKLFGEKWLLNKNAFRDQYSTKTMRRIWNDIRGHLNPLNIYTYFGDKVERENSAAVILHARAGTVGGINIPNTHPFINDLEKPTVALIHNGGVRNHTMLTKKFSTCDSETILWEYLNEGVADNPKHIQAVANTISGWYACAVLNSEAPTPYMELFTDGAPIHVAYIQELDVYIYSTGVDDIVEIAQSLDFNATCIAKLKPGTLLRFNAFNGKVINELSFTPDFIMPTYDGVSREHLIDDSPDVEVEEPPNEEFQDDVKQLLERVNKG